MIGKNPVSFVELSRHWPGLVIGIGLLLLLLPPILLVSINRELFAAVYLAACLAFILVHFPKACFGLFMIANYFYMPFETSFLFIHPGDLCAVMFIASMTLAWFFEYRPQISISCFDYNILALAIATIISGVFAYSPQLSIVPIMRIILIFLFFKALYSFSGKYSLDKMVHFFIWLHAIFSIYNIFYFISLGGSWRVFGFAGLGFETFSLTIVPITLAYAIWSTSSLNRKLYFAFFLFGILATMATMSRGPLLTIIIVCPVLIIASYIKAKHTGLSHQTRFLKYLVVFILPSIIVLFISSVFFEVLSTRIEEALAQDPTGTILTRLTLWKTAVKAFLLSPVSGIGIGNYWLLDNLIPSLKFDPVRIQVEMLSFHNVFLQYLAETGIIGATALLALAINVLSKGRQILTAAVNNKTMSLSFAAFIASVTFFVTIFYMRVWTWGQEGFIFAFIMVLIARQYNSLKSIGQI